MHLAGLLCTWLLSTKTSSTLALADTLKVVCDMSVTLFLFYEFRVVNVLLEQGADPNARDEFISVNATARKLSLNPLQVLKVRETEFSDRLNSRSTFKGFTPLHYAVLTDNRELIRLVLDSGADPLAENDLGHRAQEYCGNDEVRQLLVEYENKVGAPV